MDLPILVYLREQLRRSIICNLEDRCQSQAMKFQRVAVVPILEPIVAVCFFYRRILS